MTIPLDADALRAGLRGSRWSPITVKALTGSTNADLMAELKAGRVGSGAVELAAAQDHGRGRLTRTWSSPPGRSIALSVVVTPPANQPWTLLPLLTGLAVAEAIQALGAPAQVKWPNDVLINERKCCGILVETAQTADGPRAVIGLGLNISQSPDELPVPSASSLALAGVTVSREQAAVAVLRRLDELLAQAERDANILDRYRAQSATLGRSVRLTLGDDQMVVGQAQAIAADGQLGVMIDGQLSWFAAGDVQHLRPADQPTPPPDGSPS